MPGRTERIADPTTRLLKERVARLYRQLPRALGGDEEALHQMRVSARRLRVALPLVAQRPDGKRVRRTRRLLRDLTRGGGASRDLDVITSLFGERLRAEPHKELQGLLRELRAARSRCRRRLAGDLLDVDLKRLRRDLDVILRRRGEPVFTVFGRLREAVEAERDAIQASLDACGEAFDPPALHRVRIRFRRLRYTAEVVDALRGRESEAPDLFREVQESVGRLHDAWVLSEWLARRAARAAARGEGALAEAAARERDLAMEAARRHHAELVAKDPRGLLGRGLEALLAPRAA
ncbi:MAG TPA: CHAD domain-containing protein [Vicinamibacteria bacterium]|nr:CHAD domain-containing protein [Vicinamibacteria bacterium]